MDTCEVADREGTGGLAQAASGTRAAQEESAALYERYRPKTWGEVVGQDKAIAKIRLAGGQGFGGLAFWLSGPTGIGKTTIARLIAAEIASPWAITEMDAQDLSLPELREIEDGMDYYGLGKGGKAYIVNEAHGLRDDVIRRLLTVLEHRTSHVVWVFTTTRTGQERLFADHDDAAPLLSRCCVINLTNQGCADAFGQRAREIATAENLNGQPAAAYRRLAQDCHNNFREMLQRIGMGEMAG